MARVIEVRVDVKVIGLLGVVFAMWRLEEKRGEEDFTRVDWARLSFFSIWTHVAREYGRKVVDIDSGTRTKW